MLVRLSGSAAESGQLAGQALLADGAQDVEGVGMANCSPLTPATNRLPARGAQGLHPPERPQISSRSASVTTPEQ
jgi:hypothetical protein